MPRTVGFGWLTPVIGNRWSDHQPIVTYQERHILPKALPHFETLWLADHFYGFDAKTDPFMEAWTTMTWLAAKFPDVMLCHHVLGQGYRNPALTAKMAATLQVLSGNRFILGIGAGWRSDEFSSYGYDFPKPSVRFGQLEDTINICRALWTQDVASYQGRYYSITEAAAPPRPEVVPPICIGAAGEQIALPLVGRLADHWNGPLRRDEVAWLRKKEIVERSAEIAGRDPDSIEKSVTLERALPTTDVESAEMLEHLEHLSAIGVDHFVMDFGHPPSIEPVYRFVEQVAWPIRRSRP